MSAPATPLTQQLLAVLFAEPDIHWPWKDELSDWLIDLVDGVSSTPADAVLDPHNPHALLDHLFVYHPQVLERLLENPRVKDELEAFLTPVDQSPPAAGGGS